MMLFEDYKKYSQKCRYLNFFLAHYSFWVTPLFMMKSLKNTDVIWKLYVFEKMQLHFWYLHTITYFTVLLQKNKIIRVIWSKFLINIITKMDVPKICTWQRKTGFWFGFSVQKKRKTPSILNTSGFMLSGVVWLTRHVS